MLFAMNDNYDYPGDISFDDGIDPDERRLLRDQTGFELAEHAA